MQIPKQFLESHEAAMLKLADGDDAGSLPLMVQRLPAARPLLMVTESLTFATDPKTHAQHRGPNS